ncbi:MAG: TetR/AcrR family transcriptional regulator [Methyloceanibacter sp.]|uniref:TetR/AcrR family transcriptional regulator n=1 Tax=Methyloceanibacter sp. TaxID=1965321 RepID=UPI003D6CE820
MPYTPQHKAETRSRIVDAARRLFNRRGLNGVSIDEIMAEAGLTRGGFYNHFNAKDELYAEVVAGVLSCASARRQSAGDTAEAGIAHAFIAAYLSQARFDDRENSCPLMALPSDVARSGEPVKRAYAQVLDYVVGHLEEGLSGPASRRRAMAIAALCIGGMAVARAVDDAELAREVREAAEEAAFSLANWAAPRVEAAE